MSVSIYFGENKDAGVYQNDKILSCDAETSVTVIGDTISVDQFHAEVVGSPNGSVQFTTVSDEIVYDANDSLFHTTYGSGVTVNEIAYGTPIWFYIDNVLYGKYYFSSVDRISESSYRITAVSVMGLLDTIYCNGGIYYDDTFTEVIADIIGNTVSYTVDSQLASIPVRGWLPVSTKKDALHQLMLAVGCDLKKDANGNMVFYFNNGNTSKTIPDSRIYLDGTMVNNSQATEVDVTEHTFINDPSDATITIYDNTNSDDVVNARIDFSSAPVHDLVATGTITITESNCNYAIISGKGKLTGKKYTHTTRLTRAVDLAATGSTNIATVDAGTLISDLNSGNVAQRLLAYYKSASTINADIIVDGEKSGDKVELTNPFGEQSSAFIKSMEIIGIGVVSARCEFITGYTPCFQGNTYHEAVILTGSGTYTVPAGKNYITAILIGGGSGGNGGGRGSNGESGATYQESGRYYQDSGNGGNGGAAGTAGAGGKIFQRVIPVTAGQTISYSCGTGGAGGAGNGGAGAAGTHTTFGDLDSNNGSPAVDGVVNRYSGIAYGVKGTNGTAGGRGGDGGFNISYSAGNAGQGVQTWSGGAGGAYTNDSVLTVIRRLFGNGGGGAAVGANGSAGGNGARVGGKGGNGASSNVAGAAATVYGSGGNGGNGGGGGGGNGGTDSTDDTWTQSGGQGGNGSAGGSGANGCVIIYV